ncbi:hypothetical protein [Planctomicrobium sp. SH664]|uniref:hypothetical protein n=1 Tax=Planctomicrobium sp. SH664 TaxID=3448125 RepID=UPI003F5B8668
MLRSHITSCVLLRSLVLSLVPALGLLAVTASSASAQLTRGFATRAGANATNEELVRQRDFWIMEVELKPMRMVVVNLKDPQTGELKPEPVWYLAWRAIRRPVAGRDQGDIAAQNELDPLPGPRQFVPEFTLVAYDNPKSEIPSQILTDEILIPAMQEIQRIERDHYKNTVTVVQDLPEPTPSNLEEQQWIYGAATWRGVDPSTDFFKVILSGFTNGYDSKPGPEGTPQIWRKVLVQRFARPGDEFDPHQKEFLISGNPEWTYQPDAGKPEAASAKRPVQQR